MAPFDALQRITVAMTPAVMVSACALVALGLDNQVARMALRVRDLVREHRALPAADERRALLRVQVDAFDERHLILTRALMLDYGALLSFVLTSFLVLLSALLPVPSAVPMALFTLGVAMMGAMAVFVMISMGRARRALTVERGELELARREQQAPGSEL